MQRLIPPHPCHAAVLRRTFLAFPSLFILSVPPPPLLTCASRPVGEAKPRRVWRIEELGKTKPNGEADRRGARGSGATAAVGEMRLQLGAAAEDGKINDEGMALRKAEEAVLRNGLVLCKVLNRVNPGAVPKGGSSMKVVDCILCLKGYHEWKLSCGIGIWRYGGIVKIAPSSKRLPSHSSRFGGSADQNQQMLEFVHLLSEVSLEEIRVRESQHSLFQHFVLRVMRAFLLEWSEADMVRSLLRKMMKDGNGVCSKLELIEAISKYLKENSECLFSMSRLSCGSHKYLNDGGGLERQQEELELELMVLPKIWA